MPEQGTDRVLSIVRGYAQLCLADLQAAGELRSEVVVESDGKLTVLVVLVPTPPATQRPDLSDCERGCLTILAQARQGQVLSTPQIRDSLERQHLGIWGETTVKRALRTLRWLGLVCSSKRKPKGFWLAERAAFPQMTL